MHKDNCKYDDALKSLTILVKTQSKRGSYDYDPYTHGLANGLICALACLKDEKAEYLKAPKIWLRDKKNNKLTKE